MKYDKIRIIKILIFVLAGLTVLVGVGYLIYSWNSPIDPALNLPMNEQVVENGKGTEGTQLAVTEEILITPTPTIQPVCGAPTSLNILVSGIASNNYLYGLADAIRIVKVDFQTKKVSILALPRDLWVDIPNLESRGIDVGKLNQAYFYGSEGMGYYTGSGYGSGLLAETVFDNFGFRADRYIAVNLNSFRNIVDTLGGIDVYLPSDVYKKEFEEPVLFLKAGSHHLNGKQAEQLARQRITIGDLGRINNQTIIIKSLAVQMLTPSSIAALPSLIEQLRSNIQTDLSPADISQLICLAGMLDYDQDIRYLSLPEESLVEQMVFDPTRGLNTAALIGDKEMISQFISELLSWQIP